MASLNRNNDPAAATRFELQTGGPSGVSSRISSVFDSLNGLEAKHKAWERSRKEESFLKDDPDVAEDLATKSSTSMEGVFKRPWTSPGGPCKRPRSGASCRISPTTVAPDFKLHPERWTRYSLESVSEDDMSEASNKAAALDYLRERRLLKQQSRQADGIEASGDAGMKHIFHKRPLEGDAEMEDDSGEPHSSHGHGPGKLIMPECVVGAKPFGAKKTPRDSRPRSTSLPAVRSSSLISFDCGDYDDNDDLEVDEAEGENSGRSAQRDAVKKAKARALRTRVEDEDD